MMNSVATEVDALVIGGGIAGLQAAIDLANQGFEVLIVEKEPSIGGKMIGLSKVFPTLDCCSCICTPRMAEAEHHPRSSIITPRTSAVDRENGSLLATLIRKPRYVDADRCTGCRLCEYACNMLVPHEFEGGLGARKAIYVPFANAVPQLAVLDLDNCMLCGNCQRANPTGAIDFLQEPRELVVRAATVIIATGYEMIPAGFKTEFGGGEAKNVLTALQVERLLAPHGPYGRVLRPSTAKSRSRLPSCNAPVPATGARACLTALGSAACTRSNRQCCSAAPCRWRI